MTALSKPATRFPWSPLRLLRLFATRVNTEHTLVALVGWHWEHLWSKGRRMGGGGGQRTQIGGTQTLHCALPQQMGKAK